MKIFRIKNRRNTLATNSSSTHSVVYKTKDKVFEDLGIFDNRYYDRYTETIAASREAKIRYIFSNIFRWDALVEIMSERYPEMKEYYPMVKEYFEIYCDENKWEEMRKANGKKYLDLLDDLATYNFGDHCRGHLYNTNELQLSYEYLCNIIDSPDIIIVGGSDEADFIYDKIEGCQKLDNEFAYMDKVNDKIKNGNYYILYGEQFGNKEKLRMQVDNIPDMIPEYPELVDLKITDACEHNCPFCYMGSTPNGKHADRIDIFNIIRKFEIKTEFALGGGNVLLNPNFTDIVKCIDKRKHIANITIRFDDIQTINDNKNIKDAILKHVSGIGISVQKEKDVQTASDFIYEMLKIGKHVSLHIIPEMLGIKKSVDIVKKMRDINENYYNDCETDKTLKWNYCKVLFLGMKQTGRATNLIPTRLTNDDINLLETTSDYQYCVDTAFINTYNEWFKENYNGFDGFFLTRHEGEYSMFIDAVKMKAFTSSYKDDGGIDIDENTKINEVFGEIRRKNGFKVFEKPLPYYKK